MSEIEGKYEDEGSGELLACFADQIAKRRFEVPAVFFLEMYKPLTTLAYAAAQVSAPLFALLVGTQRCHALLDLLKSRANVELLITLIESRARGTAARH